MKRDADRLPIMHIRVSDTVGTLFLHTWDIYIYIVCYNYVITDLIRPLVLQEVQSPRIYRKSAHKDGKIVSPTHRPPLPNGTHLR
jgi:hypothetical protein